MLNATKPHTPMNNNPTHPLRFSAPPKRADGHESPPDAESQKAAATYPQDFRRPFPLLPPLSEPLLLLLSESLAVSGSLLFCFQVLFLPPPFLIFFPQAASSAALASAAAFAARSVSLRSCSALSSLLTAESHWMLGWVTRRVIITVVHGWEAGRRRL